MSKLKRVIKNKVKVNQKMTKIFYRSQCDRWSRMFIANKKNKILRKYEWKWIKSVNGPKLVKRNNHESEFFLSFVTHDIRYGYFEMCKKQAK